MVADATINNPTNVTPNARSIFTANYGEQINLLISFRYCAGMDIHFYWPLWSGLNYMISTFYNGVKTRGYQYDAPLELKKQVSFAICSIALRNPWFYKSLEVNLFINFI